MHEPPVLDHHSLQRIGMVSRLRIRVQGLGFRVVLSALFRQSWFFPVAWPKHRKAPRLFRTGYKVVLDLGR